jgi:hypothetical protein
MVIILAVALCGDLPPVKENTNMTAEERKRALRAAVEAKVHAYSPNFRMLYPDQTDLLWEIIDSIVDEIADTERETRTSLNLAWCILVILVVALVAAFHP